MLVLCTSSAPWSHLKNWARQTRRYCETLFRSWHCWFCCHTDAPEEMFKHYCSFLASDRSYCQLSDSCHTAGVVNWLRRLEPVAHKHHSLSWQHQSQSQSRWLPYMAWTRPTMTKYGVQSIRRCSRDVTWRPGLGCVVKRDAKVSFSARSTLPRMNPLYEWPRSVTNDIGKTINTNNLWNH